MKVGRRKGFDGVWVGGECGCGGGSGWVASERVRDSGGCGGGVGWWWLLEVVLIGGGWRRGSEEIGGGGEMVSFGGGHVVRGQRWEWEKGGQWERRGQRGGGVGKDNNTDRSGRGSFLIVDVNCSVHTNPPSTCSSSPVLSDKLALGIQSSFTAPRCSTISSMAH